MSPVDLAFWILAALAVVASVAVIVHRNPVWSVILLVVTFFAQAGLFVLLHAHFLAVIQVLVYAGAIMVLFLFVVMLLNLGGPRWFEVAPTPLVVVAVALGAAFVGVLVVGGLPQFAPAAEGPAAAIPRDVAGSVEAIGSALYTAYYLPFLTTALLLLVAMVGAVVLARRER
ncbi:MAG: NADH-quinone oxidoreductase subunit J [Gemmatimonadota bacterium]|nr:NADH-quinone oxidoreductase subunit J [Gemmatimonadota bacterium]